MLWAMKVDLTQLTLRLKANDSLKLRDARGVVIRATRGVLWITQEGDAKDHTLGMLERFVVNCDGLTIISAVTQAEVRIEARIEVTKLDAGREAARPASLIRPLPVSG